MPKKRRRLCLEIIFVFQFQMKQGQILYNFLPQRFKEGMRQKSTVIQIGR